MEVQPANGFAVAIESAGTEADVKLFTLKNKNGTTLIVSNCGAAVVSLFVKDKQGVFADVVLGYDTAAGYLSDDFYIGTVVGRYANRISGDTVKIDNKLYKLSTKDGSFHQHGGAVGFNKKIFCAAPFHQATKRGVVFKYISPHLEEGFPGELTLDVIYTLDDDDAWTIEYKAVSTKTTLVNLTQHSYFNLSGDFTTTIDEHEMQIAGNHYLPVNKQQVPTGAVAAVHNTVFDFTKFKAIAADILKEDEQLQLSGGYDHSFVLEKKHTPLLKRAAVVKESRCGRKMEVYTTEPAVHFYSGNFLNNVKGKQGIIYKQRTGFCLETQHFPDAPNHPHFPSTELRPGDEFYSKTIFQFSIVSSSKATLPEAV